jgi:hypothetical protein
MLGAKPFQFAVDQIAEYAVVAASTLMGRSGGNDLVRQCHDGDLHLSCVRSLRALSVLRLLSALRPPAAKAATARKSSAS